MIDHPLAPTPAPKERPIAQLRATVSMLCNYIWTKQTRPGEHVWSIPVDKERDFDCILSDAIDELQARRLAEESTPVLHSEGRIAELEAENRRLDGLINNPHLDDFLEAVRLEAAHQQERWPAEGDAGKSDADWFWLIGYLAGKALNKPEKQVHHIITAAAACLNWHAHKTGAATSMRPGIAPPCVPSQTPARTATAEPETPELAKALLALVLKIDAVMAHPDYRGVFTLAFVHGMSYGGPKFDTELLAAKEALLAPRKTALHESRSPDGDGHPQRLGAGDREVTAVTVPLGINSRAGSIPADSHHYIAPLTALIEQLPVYLDEFNFGTWMRLQGGYSDGCGKDPLRREEGPWLKRSDVLAAVASAQELTKWVVGLFEIASIEAISNRPTTH